MSRAAELLELVLKILEADEDTDSDSKETKKTERVKNPDIGKTQPVGEYPNSPLSFRGMGR